MRARVDGRIVTFSSDDGQTTRDICLAATKDLRKSEQRYVCEFDTEFATIAAVFDATVEAVVGQLVALRAIPSVSTLTHVDRKSLQLKPGTVNGNKLSIEVIPPGKFAVS